MFMDHQPSLQSLQAEIKSLRLERDGYRVKYGKARTEVASLQTRLDEVNDEVADLKRAVEQASEARRIDLGRRKPQVMLPAYPLMVAGCVHEEHMCH